MLVLRMVNIVSVAIAMGNMERLVKAIVIEHVVEMFMTIVGDTGIIV